MQILRRWANLLFFYALVESEFDTRAVSQGLVLHGYLTFTQSNSLE